MRLQARIKRGHSRYPIDGKFEGNELSSSYHAKKKTVTFRGQVKHISDGGFCLVATHAPKQSALVKASSGSLICRHRSPRSFKSVG